MPFTPLRRTVPQVTASLPILTLSSRGVAKREIESCSCEECRLTPILTRNLRWGCCFLRPVLLLSLCVIAGVGVFALGLPWYALAVPLLVVAGFMLKRSALYALVTCLCLALGYWRAALPLATAPEYGAISTTVQATSMPVTTASGYFRGVVHDLNNGANYHLYWSEPWESGLRMEVRGELVAPSPPKNPGEFDYLAHLERQGIGGLCFAKSIKPVALYRKSPLEILRGFCRANLQVLNQGSQGLGLALVLGDRTLLEASQQENWRRAGASHILAVSGLHILIAAGAVHFIFRRFSGFRASLTAAAATAVLYALLVGSSPSAWRAALAFVLVAVAKISLRQANTGSVVSVVAAVMLLINPQAALDPGFLLSFAATTGLFVLGPSLNSTLVGPGYIRGLLSSTIAAQLATLPIILHYFGAFPLYGLIANLLLVPLAPFLVGTALITAAVGRLPLVGPIAAAAFSATAWLCNSVVGLVARLPYASLGLVGLPLVAVFLYYLLLWLIPRTKRLGQVAVFAALILVVLLPSVVHRGDMTLTFLSIGNADACHVRIGRSHYLIDTGTADAAQRIVLPYLRSQGVNTLAGVFISHGHDDHVGGLPVLEQELKVGQVFCGPGVEEKQGYLDLAGMSTVSIGTASLKIMQAKSPALDLNNQSVVMLLLHNQFRALFTGDIGHPAERLLHSEITKVDALKVAHHGSAASSSSQFLAGANPSVAVICVGPNSYGHPSTQVVNALESLKALVLRTDEAGAVRITVKKTGYEVHNYLGGRWHHVAAYTLSSTDPRAKGRYATRPLSSVWGRGVLYRASSAAD